MHRPPSPPPEEAFHAGERALQSRTGSREQLAIVGSKIMRDAMPQQHRDLFAKLPFVVLGALDAEGRPWAELLAGPPGFVSTPDARTLRVRARPDSHAPLATELTPGASVGLLGIELPTRRRNRVNGVIAEAGAGHFTVHVQQSFGNCPKYIQVREPTLAATAAEAVTWQPEGPRLSPEATALVRRADTFFIATATPDANDAPVARSSGVDVSHRGGKPGFVRVEAGGDAAVLTVPDFVGNFFFNTLGNLALDPRAGLLFADFASGDLLTLSGRAEVLWEGPELEAFRGAERLLRFRPAAGWFAPGALPLRDHGAPELSPYLEGTGSWDEVASTVEKARA